MMMMVVYEIIGGLMINNRYDIEFLEVAQTRMILNIFFILVHANNI